jgi:hypothetical protein
MAISLYKYGISTDSPVPSGDAGLMINTNFTWIADNIANISGVASIPLNLVTTSGNFTGNISASSGIFSQKIFAGGFSGNGSLLTNLNASNITTGTIPNANTTATQNNTFSTIMFRDNFGNFSATSGIFSGSISSISGIFSQNVYANGFIGASGIFSGYITAQSGTFQKNVQASGFIGSAAGLTSINAGSINTGTLGIAFGGTGQATASTAINALLPSQTSNNGKFLSTNGSSSSWNNISLSDPVTLDCIEIDGRQYAGNGYLPSISSSANLAINGLDGQTFAIGMIANSNLITVDDGSRNMAIYTGDGALSITANTVNTTDAAGSNIDLDGSGNLNINAADVVNIGTLVEGAGIVITDNSGISAPQTIGIGLNGASVSISAQTGELGFFGAAPIAQYSGAGVSTVADIITILTAYGLLS